MNGNDRPVRVIGEAPKTSKVAQVVPPAQVTEVVATLAKVLTPEKYGMLPMTAAEEVERPPKVSVLSADRSPPPCIGHVVFMRRVGFKGV